MERHSPAGSSKTGFLDAPLNAIGFEIGDLTPQKVTGRLQVTQTCCQVKPPHCSPIPLNLFISSFFLSILILHVCLKKRDRIDDLFADYMHVGFKLNSHSRCCMEGYRL